MTLPSTEALRDVVDQAKPAIQQAQEMIRDIAMDFETAAIAVSELEGKQEQNLDGTTIYSGRHPKYGNIHIVMPAAGNGMMLLPFVFRDF